MAEKRPICLYDGQLQELASGDTLPGNSGGSGPVIPYSDQVNGLTPLLYYRLGESAGPTCVDETGNFNGTYNGAPTFDEPSLLVGDADTAVNFPTSVDYVDGGFIGDVGFPLSIACSVNVSSLGIRGLFTTHGGGAGNYKGIAVYTESDGKVSIRIGNGGGTLSSHRKNFKTDNAVITPGTTHHIVAVLTDMNTCLFYVDGISVPVSYFSGAATTMDTASGSLRVGRIEESSIFGSVSTIDDFSIHQATLTAQEVSDLYDASQAQLFGPATGGTVYSKTLSMPGQLSVINGNARWYPPANITLVDVNVSVGTAPAGSAINVDVNKNGVSIVSNGFDISAGANQSGAQVPTDLDLDTTDYLTVDVNQIGSNTPGSDLHLQIQYTRD